MKLYDGKHYYSVDEFALLTKRMRNHIYILIKHGNKTRKLKAIKIDNKWHIPDSEVDGYPFTDASVIDIKYKELEVKIESALQSLATRINQLERLLKET